MIVIIGDVHGKWNEYSKILNKYPNEISIQIGDCGVGFPKSPELILPKNAFWFRGNHDNPDTAKNHPNHLGDFGSKIIDGIKIFWVAGSWSIDQQFRIPGWTWWEDEELSIRELETAMEQYLKVKPDVMLTHDTAGPFASKILSKYSIMGDGLVYPTRTGQALSAMFEAYQPKLWVCGHYHASVTEIIKGTKFICLNELESLELTNV